MNETAGGTTRLKAAKSAVNSVAKTLLGKNGKNEAPKDLVEMGLITFANKATVQSFILVRKQLVLLNFKIK